MHITLQYYVLLYIIQCAIYCYLVCIVTIACWSFGFYRSNMTKLTFVDVEEWLDANPDSCGDYFLRKANLSLINKWLLNNGYNAVTEQALSVGRRSSMPMSSPLSPISPVSDSILDTHVEGVPTPSSISKPKPPPRTNSRKFLRQDFAKCKNKHLFRTCEAAMTLGQPVTDVDARRSSLKGMRKYTSLPPSSINMLSLLIESKIRLPNHVSKDVALLNELRRTNEREFFLNIVMDIANEMDMKRLSSKIIQNICILLDADRASLFQVRKTRKGKFLVSKVFDPCWWTSILPPFKGDNIVQVAWGKGITGHVAESGDTVNISKASQVRH